MKGQFKMGNLGDNFKAMLKGSTAPGVAEEPEALDNAAEETDEERSSRIGSNLGKYLHPKRADRVAAAAKNKAMPSPEQDVIRKPADMIGTRG